MVHRWTRMKLLIVEKGDAIINVKHIFSRLRIKYEVHFAGTYFFEYNKYLYIQVTSKSRFTPSVVIKLLRDDNFDFQQPEKFETTEGDPIDVIGSVRKQGQGKKSNIRISGGDVNITNNNITNNNTTNNININIQIVRPNGVGEESLSHVTAEDLDQIMRALDSKKFPTILDVEIYLRVLAKFADVLIRDIKNCNVKGRQNDALYKYVSPGGVWLHERKGFGFVHRIHDNWVNHLKTCFEEHKGDMSPEYLESFERCNEMLMELRKRGDERYERVAIIEGTAIMGNMAERVKFGEKHENLKLDGY